MPRSRQVLAILNRIAAAEEQFLRSAFLAPVPVGGQVRVRIAGVVCCLRVVPSAFEGWGIFQPSAPGQAGLLCPANPFDRLCYLELFPRRRVVLCCRQGRHWLALPAQRGDRRFRLEGMLPIYFVDEGQPFDVVEVRYDGAQCWYDRHDATRDPGLAAYLRQALEEMVEPELLHRRGLTPEERSAYALRYQAILEAHRARPEERLRDARKQNVRVAGICLNGVDHEFDLQSLVGVLR